MKGTNKMILWGIILLIMVFKASIFAFVMFAPQLGAKSDKDILLRMEKAPNYKNGKFYNLSETSMKFDFEWDKMKSFFDDTDRKPIEQIPIEKININDLYSQDISHYNDRIKIWW